MTKIKQALKMALSIRSRSYDYLGNWWYYYAQL